jgi:NADH dehydrogenase FAD-containing subunit
MGDCASVSGEHYAATAQVAEQQGTYLARWLNEAAAAGAGRSAAPPAAAGIGATAGAGGGAGFQAASTAGGPAAAAGSDSAAAGSTTTALPAAIAPFSRYQPKGPFEYHHGGSLAFIGGFSAVSDFTQGSAIAPLYGAKLKGWVSFAVWRSAYLTKQGSWRNRMQVPVDWTRTLLFGRDTTAF